MCLRLVLCPLQLSTETKDGGVGLGKVETNFIKLKPILREEEDGEEEEEEGEDGEGKWKKREAAFPKQPLTPDESKARDFLSGEECAQGVSEGRASRVMRQLSGPLIYYI